MQGIDAIYLMIDSRSMIGNDVLFWAKDHNGYTTNIDKAHKFSAEDAKNQENKRSTDRAIPWSEVVQASRRAVDFQILDRKYFQMGYKHFQKNATVSDSERIISQLKGKLIKMHMLFKEMDTDINGYGQDYEFAIATAEKKAEEILDQMMAR